MENMQDSFEEGTDKTVKTWEQIKESMREIQERMQDLNEPPIFSGKDPDKWLRRLEIYLKFNRIPADRWFLVVRQYSGFYSKHWFDFASEIYQYLTWSLFKELFIERFGSLEIQMNKEVETALVEDMSSDLKKVEAIEGSIEDEAQMGNLEIIKVMECDSRREEADDDGMKKSIMDVSLDSSRVLSSDIHQEVLSDIIQVHQEEPLIHQGEENTKLLLLPEMSSYQEEGHQPAIYSHSKVPEVENIFLGHQMFQKLGVKASCLLEMALYRRWNSVTSILPISFYIDTGQNQKVEENRHVLKMDIFVAGKKEGNAAVKEWGFLVSAKQKITQKETKEALGSGIRISNAILRYGQQHKEQLQRFVFYSGGQELLDHMIMMKCHNSIPTIIWAGPFINLGRNNLQNKRRKQFQDKEITTYTLPKNFPTAAFYLEGRLKVGVQSANLESANLESVHNKKNFAFPKINRGEGFQLIACSFIHNMCIRLYGSSMKALQTISKDLMVLDEFSDEHSASKAVWSREIASVRRSSCDLEITVFQLLKSMVFQWLIAWKVGLTKKLVLQVVDFWEECWSRMDKFF